MSGINPNTPLARQTRGGNHLQQHAVGYVRWFVITIFAHGILLSLRVLPLSFQDSIVGMDDPTALTASNVAPQLQPLQQQQQQFPHWRMTTDCSAFSLDCVVHKSLSHRYAPYTFPSIKDLFPTKELFNVPLEWSQKLKNQSLRKNQSSSLYVYPPEASSEEYSKCLEFTKHKTTMQQLEEILGTKRITAEERTGMIAFTVADINYAKDMIHDIFQSFETIVGFSQQSFFMAAIDTATVELACRFNYPVIMWKADRETLRDSVANAKIVLSYELVKRGKPFFFSEMDVWWLHSPIPSLEAFVHSSTNGEMIFSSHQNAFSKLNIGVYASKANEKTVEYFQLCIELLKEKPNTHDQYVMAQLSRLYEARHYRKQDFQFGDQFSPAEPPPSIPNVTHPFIYQLWNPHEITADERPVPAETTLAIHTLNGIPLQKPHGKKMVAKELGVWYGFESKGTHHNSDNTQGGYYNRTDEYRRYIWLDGPMGNTYSLQDASDRYHNNRIMSWTMAALIAIARRTNRIFILPKVIYASSDAGLYFLWTLMDYSALEGVVEFRETNFPSNPKAWKSRELPFSSVATTAFLNQNTTLFVEVSHDGGLTNFFRHAWNTNRLEDSERMDAWIGALTGEPQIDSAELLLVNPDIIDFAYINRLSRRLERQAQLERLGTKQALGVFEKEIVEIHGLLRWCYAKGFRHSASKVSASHSCYGKGINQ